jgi:hypothetical protein
MTDPAPIPADLGFEDALQRLEQIVQKLGRRCLAGAQAADLVAGPPVPVLVGTEEAFARQRRLPMAGEDDGAGADGDQGRGARNRRGNGRVGERIAGGS